MSTLTQYDPVIRKAFKYFEESIDWSGGDGESILFDFYQQYPEYDPDQTEGAKPYPKRLFNDWFREMVFRRIDGVRDEIEYRFENDLSGEDFIPIWRVITAPLNWEPDVRELGIYWSWDKNAAEAHWGGTGKGHVKWRIGSVAKRKQIDWPITLALNAHPSLGEEEKEIRLKEGQKVPIVSLEVSEDRYGRSFREVPTATWSGKLFRANP